MKGLVFCLLLLAFQVSEGALLALPEAEVCGADPVVPATSSGSCVKYKDHLADGSLGFCSGVVDYEYYLPTGLDQETIEAQLQSQFSATAQTLLPLLPGTCLTGIKAAVCASSFQKCRYVDPYYLSCNNCRVCSDRTGVSICAGTNEICAPRPGYAVGTQVTWEVALGDSTQCPEGLKYDEDAKSCMKAVPVAPCSQNFCENIQGISNAVCPVVSGKFYTRMRQLLDADVTNSKLKVLLEGSLGTCATAVDAQDVANCQQVVYNMNLVSLLGLNADCDATSPLSAAPVKLFPEEYIIELSTGGSIGLLMRGKAQALRAQFSDDDDVCGTYPANDQRNSCNNIDLNALCDSTGSQFRVQTSYTTIGSDPEGRDRVCANVTTSDVNQPVGSSLDLLAIATGVSKEDARKLYYVPTQPGMPIIPVYNQGKVVPFMGQKEGAPDLCSYPTSTGEALTGKSSLDCLLNQLKVGLAAVPGWVNSECRAAFLDMACSKAMMKLEVKTLCFNADGCDDAPTPDAAVNKRLPFVYALPRFASNEVCTNMLDKCGAYFGSLSEDLQALINSRLACDQKVEISCAQNSFNSSYWPCESPFNGLSSFPESRQGFIDLGGLVSLLQLPDPIDSGYLAQSASSSVTNPTISDVNVWDKFDRQDLCECPFPLRVPPNPNNASTGLTEFTCCDLACEGSFFQPEVIDDWTSLQLMLSIPNFLASAFVVITWALFKTRGEQKLTLYFALSSMGVSAVFLIALSGGDPTNDVWCQDATTPSVQEDGGMCLFQAIGISYFGLSCCCWWWCQAFALFQKIYMVRNVRSPVNFYLKYHKFYHAFAWGWPAVVTAVFLAKGSLGYRAPQPWCFMAESDDGSGVELGLWYGTIFVITVTGITMMTLVLYTMFTITRGSSKRTNGLRIYQVPTFFVMFFVLVWVIIISWRMVLETQRQDVADGVIPWVSCLLSNYAAGITDPAYNPLANTTILDSIRENNQDFEGCGDLYPRGLGLEMFFVVQAAATAQGICVYLIFGLMPQNYKLWAVFLGCRDPDVLKDNDRTLDDDHTTKEGTSKSRLRRLLGTVTGTNGGGNSQHAESNTKVTFTSVGDDPGSDFQPAYRNNQLYQGGSANSGFPRSPNPGHLDSLGGSGYQDGSFQGSYPAAPGSFGGGGSFNSHGGSFNSHGGSFTAPPGLDAKHKNGSMNSDDRPVAPSLPPRKNPIARFTARMSRMVARPQEPVRPPARRNKTLLKTELESSTSQMPKGSQQVSMSELQRAQQAVAMRRRAQLQEWKEKAGLSRASVRAKPTAPPPGMDVEAAVPRSRKPRAPSEHRRRRDGDRREGDRRRGGQRKHRRKRGESRSQHGGARSPRGRGGMRGGSSFDEASDSEALDSLI